MNLEAEKRNTAMGWCEPRDPVLQVQVEVLPQPGQSSSTAAFSGPASPSARGRSTPGEGPVHRDAMS